jgi:hypothetical protein
MRALGILLLLFGIATIVLFVMEVHVEFLAWINNWGEDAAWGIRGGAVLLGLVLMMAGGKKKDGKKH